MQFPVPQFTDVEDKIIGPFTVKQFGIVFGAGVVVFLGYSSTKSVPVAVFMFLVVGLPALGLAFARINGRPLYNTMGDFVKFFMSPRVLIFHKEAVYNSQSKSSGVKTELTSEASKTKPEQPLSPEDNLKKVQELLKHTAQQEKEEVNTYK